VLPVAAGWGILAWESQTRANASYDAFKIISVFYPGLLASLIGSLPIFLGSRRSVGLAGLITGVVLFVNLMLAAQFRFEMMNPPLRVDRTLIELGRLEKESRVASLNMRVEDFWARLWANYFLLRKAQYFTVHTYEGRLNTPLRGQWDLSDSLLKSVPADPADFLAINPHFHVERVGAAGRVTLNYGDGWHEIEGEGNNRWRWTSGDARVEIVPAGEAPVRTRLTAQVRAVTPRLLVLSLDRKEIGRWSLDGTIQTIVIDAVEFPAGKSVLSLTTDQPAKNPGGGDARNLSVALYELKIEALPAH
jgi:hypothetical protein